MWKAKYPPSNKDATDGDPNTANEEAPSTPIYFAKSETKPQSAFRNECWAMGVPYFEFVRPIVAF